MLYEREKIYGEVYNNFKSWGDRITKHKTTKIYLDIY